MTFGRLVTACLFTLLPLSALAQEAEFSDVPAGVRTPLPTRDVPARDAPAREVVPRDVPAPAPSPRAELTKAAPKTWSESARFFVGARTGVGVPPGGDGLAPTVGVEVGVSADSGFGFGLHFVSVWNPPDAPSLNIPKAQWALGAAADARWYFQTVRPLSLYPTLSVGFLAGPGVNGHNAVLPMLNPGFGARVRLGGVYFAFEFGVLGFQVPFIAIALGWEPNRAKSDELAAD